jgi:hypothetical protein
METDQPNPSWQRLVDVLDTCLAVGRSADLRFNSRSNDATRRSLRQ